MRLFFACLLALTAGASAQKPWPIRAVVVTTFELESQLWVEREHLTETLDFPGGVHALRTNPDHTILSMASGTTLVNATASMMALGYDPRFDLTHAYFLINGIAGVNPGVASVGSAAWADYVVNDVTRMIDSREAPADWPYGFFPVGAHEPKPAAIPTGTPMRSNLYAINPKLVAWAWAQTKDLKLIDDPKVADFRTGFTGYPNAMKPPFVLIGASFASDYYWHGVIMTQFAIDWVNLYTAGRGTFAMTEMEDSGFMEALERLDKVHRTDINRVLVLRSGSNYSMPRPGHTPIESVTSPYIGTHVAVESAWLCGSTVLHAILSHWDVTRNHIPGVELVKVSQH